MAVAEPLWNVGSWEVAFVTGETPWLVQVRSPAQAVLSSCLGLGKPESIASLRRAGEQSRTRREGGLVETL